MFSFFCGFLLWDRLTVHGVTTKLQIWDTAGQEQFKKLAPMYYKNSAAAIVCYDATNPKSLEEARYWVNELRTNVSLEGIVLVVCATKCDLNVELDTQRARMLAQEFGAIFVETSAKDNVNVTYLFETLVSRVLNLREPEGGSRTIGSSISRGSSPLNGSTRNLMSPEQRIQGFTEGDPRNSSFTMDEKKFDDDDMVLKRVREEPMDSKCDPTTFMCGDAGEMMTEATVQKCGIQ